MDTHPHSHPGNTVQCVYTFLQIHTHAHEHTHNPLRSTHTCPLTQKSAPLQQCRGCWTRPPPRTHSSPQTSRMQTRDLLSHRQHVEARKLLACPSLWQFPLLLLVPLPSDHVQVREQRPSWESDLPGSVVGPCPLERFL